MLRRSFITAALCMATVLAALLIAQGAGPARATKPERSYAGTHPAPAFPGGLDWLNTNETELSLEALRGKVVLLDFWAYGCITCLHVLPDLERLRRKYGDVLAVIGVHSGRFDRERLTPALRQIVARHDLAFPVVNDGDHAFLEAYGARSWPTLVVIDPAGDFVGSVTGDGHFDLLDAVIGGLVEEFGAMDGLNEAPLDLVPEAPVPADALLRFPGKVLADVDGGRLFIADSSNHRIVVTDLEGKILHLIGGSEAGSEDGDFRSAEFRYPQGMALADDNTLYVADTRNHTIRRVDLADRKVQTVAGTRHQVDQVEQAGAAGQTGLNSPWDLLWHDGLLYIAMAGQHQIWVYDREEREVRAFAGTRQESLRDGPLLEAAFAQPSGLASDGVRLFVADSEASAIRLTGFDAGADVQTLVGVGLGTFGDVDGEGETVRLQYPLGVAWLDDALAIADTFNGKVKLLDPRTRIVETLVTEGAGLSEPGGISAAGGRLFVADTNNHRIVEIDPESGALEPVPLRLDLPPTRGGGR